MINVVELYNDNQASLIDSYIFSEPLKKILFCSRFCEFVFSNSCVCSL